MTGPSADPYYRQIADGLVSRAPQDWAELEMVYREAGKLSEYSGSALTQTGEHVGLRRIPSTVADGFSGLRQLFYQQGHGVWYSAQFRLTRDGRMDLDLDHDSEPAWRIPAAPSTYLRDLELFPRDAGSLPPWLQDELAQARSGR